MSGNIFQFQWEVELMKWIQTNLLNNDLMIKLCIIFTYGGESLFAVLIIGFLYWSYDKKLGKYVGRSVILSSVLNPLVKNIFLRVRPYFVNEDIKCLKPVDADYDIYDIRAQGYSFPSGHSMCATTLAYSIYRFLKKKIFLLISIVFISLVIFSRFALGVHYPTDTFVGVILAIGIVEVVNFLDKKISNYKLMFIISILFSIGFFYCKTSDYYSGYGLLLGYFSGLIFEEKYVNFKNTNKVFKMVLRTLIGAFLFLGIHELCKMPFSEEFLHGDLFLGNLAYCLSYTIPAFIAIGVYPLVFKKINL